MRCDQLADRFEAFADGSLASDAATRAHLDGCPACAARLAEAEAIEALLASREIPAPPDGFTSAVMAVVRHDRWRVEEALDLGFNLAVAAGVLLIVAGGVGLAWSLGLFTLEVAAFPTGLADSFRGRLAAEGDNLVMAVALMLTAVGAWWWAEYEPGTDARI